MHLAEPKRGAKRKSPEWKGASKRGTPPCVIVGILFCVLGGAMLATAIVLPWAEFFDPSTNALLQTFYAHDLYMFHSSFYGPNYKFLIAYIIPLAGMVCAVLSATELLGERGIERLRRLSPPAALMSALVAFVCTILLVFFIETDVLVSTTDRAAFGSAAFVSVFGTVFAMSGGLVMTGDYLHRMRMRSGFTASAGGRQVKAALRPTGSFARMKKQKREKEEPEKERYLTEDEDAGQEGPEQEGEVCPNCSSPVMGNWHLCPICGAELDRSSEEVL
jgi:hypothetical protein